MRGSLQLCLERSARIDFDVAQTLGVTFEVSSIARVAVALKAPKGVTCSLYTGSKTAESFKLVLPEPDKPIKGDLTT